MLEPKTEDEEVDVVADEAIIEEEEEEYDVGTKELNETFEKSVGESLSKFEGLVVVEVIHLYQRELVKCCLEECE